MGEADQPAEPTGEAEGVEVTTIAAGQHIRQTVNGRIWQIISPYAPDSRDRLRWTIRLVEDVSGGRAVGEEAQVTVDWLILNCVDHDTSVKPPMGDGTQVCMIDRAEILPWRLFGTAQESIDYFVENLQPGQIGTWFGYDATDPNDPDMTVTMVDGELVWAE